MPGARIAFDFYRPSVPCGQWAVGCDGPLEHLSLSRYACGVPRLSRESPPATRLVTGCCVLSNVGALGLTGMRLDSGPGRVCRSCPEKWLLSFSS